MTDNGATDTIDITNVVETMRSTFVNWATDAVYAAIIAQPGFQWLTLPIISSISRSIIRGVLNTLSGFAVMEAFFLNTVIRKAEQAKAYVDAVGDKNNLPPTASDEEYKNAEEKEMAAFRNLILVSN